MTNTMEIYMKKLFECQEKIKIVYNSLLEETNNNWKIEKKKINDIRTNFFIESNNKKLSIACSIDTGGEIESIIILDDINYDNDSIVFHEDINALKNYLYKI